MFQNDTAQRKKEKPAERRKWAKAAGDHEVLSAKGNADTGKYIQDLNCETSERIRFKPAAPGDSRALNRRAVRVGMSCRSWPDRYS